MATYNVENLDPSDPQEKFDALAGAVVENLSSPDILALEEIQDDNGATDDGTVSADATLEEVHGRDRGRGGPAYEARTVDPENKTDGGEPGGNIRQVFLFNPERVSFTDRPAAATRRPRPGPYGPRQAAPDPLPGPDRPGEHGVGGQPQAAGRRVRLPREARSS